jgi:hypothetical protein
VSKGARHSTGLRTELKDAVRTALEAAPEHTLTLHSLWVKTKRPHERLRKALFELSQAGVVEDLDKGSRTEAAEHRWRLRQGGERG